MTDLLTKIKSLRKQQNRQKIIFVSMALGIFLLLGSLAIATQYEWDFSRGKRHSLTQTSVDLLGKIESEGISRIKFTAFMSNDPAPKASLRDLISQYQKHTDMIELDFIDPSVQPTLTRELGVTRHGEVLISVQKGSTKEQSELLRELSETSISNAILRLSRQNERFILFLEGHGERNPFGQANHDLKQFSDELSKKGFVIERFNLSQQPAIPSNTRLVVIASPQLDYLNSEVQRIQKYITDGGNLLWLSDPDGLKGLESLLNALDFFNVVSLFPQARTFELIDKKSAWESLAFLQTAERTWLEQEELQSTVNFDPEVDKQGPLNIGYSLTKTLQNSSQQRIIVIGDGDFLSNRFLNNGANLPLGLNLLDWLSGEEAFLNISFAETPDTSLDIDEKSLAWIGLFFLFVLPGFCFFIALRIWWKRRNA